MLSIVTTSLMSLWPYKHSICNDHMIHIVTASIMSLRLYYHSTYHVIMIPIDTAHITSYDPYCYNIYYVTLISTITASITSLWSLLLQQLSHHYDPYCYSNYYVQWSLLLQQLLRHYAIRYYSIQYVTLILIATAYYVTMITISGKRPPCTHSRGWRTPARCAIPGAARRTPRQTSKTMNFVLSYCFFCFAICVIRYLPNWRP